MDDLVLNGMKEMNGSGPDRIYYELDGEGDADSSTTPGLNVDPHRDRTADWCSRLGFSEPTNPSSSSPTIKTP